MKLKYLSAIMPLLMLISCSGSATPTEKKTGGEDPFNFNGNFEKSELTLDGKMDEEEWQDPTYASGPYELSGTKNVTQGSTTTKYYVHSNVYIYRGSNELFFFFDVSDTTLLSYGSSNGEDVAWSDSIEIYIDTLNDGGTTPQTDDFQFNLGINSKYRVCVGTGSNWSESNALFQYEILMDGELNNEGAKCKGYTMEVGIPYKVLNIDRNTDFGITFGIVDKYASSKASKQWYGFTYEKFYGSPRVPETYLQYIGNKMIPKYNEVEEYVEADDETVYTLDLPNVASATATSKDKAHTVKTKPISMKVARDEKNLTFLISTTEEIWADEDRLQIYFDIGSYLNISRTSSMYYIYCYPKDGIITHLYQFQGNASGSDRFITPSKLTTRIADNKIQFVIPLSCLELEDETVDMGIAYGMRTTITYDEETTDESGETKVTTSSLSAEKYSASTSNPSTFTWMDKDGLAPDFVSKETSTFVTKLTTGEDFGTIKATNDANLSLGIALTEDYLKVRVDSDIEYGTINDRVYVYMDCGDGTKTVRGYKEVLCLSFKLPQSYVITRSYYLNESGSSSVYEIGRANVLPTGCHLYSNEKSSILYISMATLKNHINEGKLSEKFIEGGEYGVAFYNENTKDSVGTAQNPNTYKRMKIEKE